jgi:hypothetical protein
MNAAFYLLLRGFQEKTGRFYENIQLRQMSRKRNRVHISFSVHLIDIAQLQPRALHVG